MKIIFINRYFFPDHSATSQLLADLAFALSGAGSSVVVVTSRQAYGEANANLPREEIIHGVRVIRVWTSRFGRAGLVGRSIDYLTFYSSALFKLLLLTGSGDVLVAKTDPPLISVIARIAARVRGARLINWIQDLFPEVARELGIQMFDGALGRMLVRIRNGSLRAAVCNVVIGEQMKRRLVGEGVAAETIEVIHNWSDENAVVPVERSRNTLRREWGLGDRFVVGYSGNMGRAHDFGIMLDAAERLKGRSDVVFLLIGDGVRRNWVEEQVVRRQLANVLLRPYQERGLLAESLSVPDVHFVSLRPDLEGLIVPSKTYGILAVGRPILFAGSRSGEIAGIVSDSDCGIPIDPDDVEAFVSAVEELVGNPELRVRMGRNARAAFEHKYGMKKSLRSWFGILRAA